MPEGEYLQFGGLAVIEGVMMRSPHFWAVACRLPNDEIAVKTEPLEKTWIGRQKWLMKPFLRGTFALLDTMTLGNKAMSYASNLQLDERFLKDDEKKKTEKDKKKQKAVEGFVVTVTVIVSLAVSFLIFDASPEAAAQTAHRLLGFSGTAANAVAEILKLILFIGYLMLIRRVPAILEVFKYHGAEHQAINCIEAGAELTPENCLLQTRLHPRCGTNFAIIVIMIGFIAFIPIPRDLWGFTAGKSDVIVVLARILVKLLVMPIVAGISYEIIRLAGKMKNQAWVNILLKPGLATQLITTEPAALKHTQVSVEALKAVQLAEATGELTNTNLDDLIVKEPIASGDAAIA
jgi:uncharacterized protein YqhQ